MGRRSGLRLLAAGLAVAGLVALPAAATAHPLGNFTINHYAGLAIASDRIELDVVIDMAEIPAFQERQRMDADGDGSVSDEEGASWATGECAARTASLHLGRDGVPVELTSGASGVSFPSGAGGLSTLRLECGYTAPLDPPIASPGTITFADRSDLERIGWREIVATGVGTVLETHGLPATSPSAKLTAYPADQIATPLDIRSATIDVRSDPRGTSGSPAAPSGTLVPNSTGPAAGAGPIASAAGPSGGSGAAAVGPVGGAVPGGAVPGGDVPGGVGDELPDIFRTSDLTPFVILASLLTAIVIGAGHALTPGHGKTLMAAYLVGTRGSALHAVGLGLSVAVSHTVGILALALVVVGAGSVLPPDVVYRVTPVVAGVSIVAIGGWMLVAEVRRRRARADGDHTHAAAVHDDVDIHDHGHDLVPGEHSHGRVRHSHLPSVDTTLSWRGLFVLGLAGGLIPSTSALLILLGSIAAGRPAFGLLLVVAFGLGMAAVMTGVGLAMIFARSRLDRMPGRSGLGRVAAVAPLAASVAVLGLGLVLTWQAVAGAPVL